MSDRLKHRPEILASQLQRLAAEFINRESGTQSLITVMDCQLSRDGKRVTISLSAWPEAAAPLALDFAKRHDRDLRLFIKEHSRIGQIPTLEFVIDKTV